MPTSPDSSVQPAGLTQWVSGGGRMQTRHVQRRLRMPAGHLFNTEGLRASLSSPLILPSRSAQLTPAAQGLCVAHHTGRRFRLIQDWVRPLSDGGDVAGTDLWAKVCGGGGGRSGACTPACKEGRHTGLGGDAARSS